MLVIYDQGEGQPLERLAVARYAVAKSFEKAWDKEEQPNQFKALANIIKQRNPSKIAINTSDAFALADGMTSTEKNPIYVGITESLQKPCGIWREAIDWVA